MPPSPLATALEDFDPTVVDRLASVLAGRVVDLGAGPGSAIDPGTSLPVRHCARELVQVDLRPARGARAEDRRLCADLNATLPFADRTFDAAVCNHVFEHLHHPSRLAGEIGRILRPGGALVTAVPNGKAVSDRLFRAFYRLTHDPKSVDYDPHHQRFTKDGFLDLLRGSGFTIAAVTDVGEGYSWLHKHPRLRSVLTQWSGRLRRRWNDAFLYGWFAIAVRDPVRDNPPGGHSRVAPRSAPTGV